MPYWQAAAAAVGAAGNYYAANQTNQANADINHTTRKWNERQRIKSQQFAKRTMKKQVRWRQKDLDRAGINPILAGQFSASAVGAPGANSGNQISAIPEVTPDAINASVNAAKSLSEIEQIDATAELTKTQQSMVRAQVAKTASEIDLIVQQQSTAASQESLNETLNAQAAKNLSILEKYSDAEKEAYIQKLRMEATAKNRDAATGDAMIQVADKIINALSNGNQGMDWFQLLQQLDFKNPIGGSQYEE